MSDWTMAQAKRDFNRALIKDVRIVDTQLGTWSVRITSQHGMNSTGWLIDARKREPRQMKSLCAAVKAVTQIGFQVKQLLIE